MDILRVVRKMGVLSGNILFPCLCLSGWLLLQTPRLVFQEGEAIVLRCHSWKNLRLLKVTFFRNGQAKWFSHANSNFSIPQANRSHSGDYHCRGFIGQTAYLSRPVTITVQGPAVPPINACWHRIPFCLAMGLLLALDTGLYVSVQRDLQSMMGRAGERRRDKKRHSMRLTPWGDARDTSGRPP
ncbi:low affinity immunoglobulin gamma Fc region receptor III-like [Tupaia chinensis]|uniref:low affinity immunoglobulin gamma Fc region receptor III-like n=1 Tax=Tupaia chinensis TaxID=246437 RepID=UPI000FFB43C7|nr:low affinity immunoglobulin gamma Fc region receptor III-like [Tupaia chinensis]